jgi:hypothetical protein
VYVSIKLKYKKLSHGLLFEYDGKVEFSIFSLIMLTALFFSLPCSWAQGVNSQDTNSITLYPIDSKPFGLSYADHVINYWKFVLAIPFDKNPSEDTTGKLCNYGQNTSNSSIFYLHGNSGGKTVKTCTIPAGLGLFIPLIYVEASTGEDPDASVAKLHETAKHDQDNVNGLYLRINNKEFSYDELKQYRTHTKDFQVTFPENAEFGANPGPATVVADGYHVITSPISPGNYTIQFKGSLVCLGVDCTEPIFATDNTYNLIVK